MNLTAEDAVKIASRAIEVSFHDLDVSADRLIAMRRVSLTVDPKATLRAALESLRQIEADLRFYDSELSELFFSGMDFTPQECDTIRDVYRKRAMPMRDAFIELTK